ncbi:MAG: tetratricopeptide repeat protein [Sphingobacteriales bacterium]|nr:MAG: tetratricopeptide repeat protein [Sphingobacteriales bacterium]
MTTIKQILWVYLACLALFLNACKNNSEVNNPAPEIDQTKEEEAAAIRDIPQIKLLTDRIARDSANAELFFLRGNIYLKANIPNLAIADFYRSLALDSVNSSYYLAAAEVFFEKNDLTTAIRLLEKGQTLLPDSMNLKTELGKYYYYIQKYDTSTNLLKQVVSAQPQLADAHFWLAMNYRDRNEEAKAIEQLKQAIKADDAFYNAHIILANLLAKNNKPEALAQFDKAIALDSLSIEARYGKALFLQNSGKTEEALNAYRQIVLVEPQHADTHYNVGYIYFNRNDYETALKHFNMAIRVSPAYAKAYYMRGLCAEKTGKITDAKNDYQSALRFDPKLTLAQEALNRVQ